METEDLTGIPLKSIWGPINCRPLKLLESPGLIVEPPQTSNEHRQNQGGYSCAVESGGQATGAERHATPRCHLRGRETSQ